MTPVGDVKGKGLKHEVPLCGCRIVRGDTQPMKVCLCSEPSQGIELGGSLGPFF